MRLPLTPTEQAKLDAAKPEAPAPAPEPPALTPKEQQELVLLVRQLQQQLVLLKTSVLKNQLTTDGIINLLANSAVPK